MFIVTKKIDSENISKLCRTCLREDNDKMVCLFVGPSGSSLAAKLQSLSCLEVCQGDGLPEKMCDKCVTRAESALLYREQCRVADKALRQALLKVKGMAYSKTANGCKLYQHNQGFIPFQTPPKTLKSREGEAVLMNHQEMNFHNRLHVSHVQENSISSQHMRIAESQNCLLNVNHTVEGSTNIDIDSVTHPSKLNIPYSTTEDNLISNRAACALHCSLCNHTFTNRTQLINHNLTHDTNNISLACNERGDENRENSKFSNPATNSTIYVMDKSLSNPHYPFHSITSKNIEIQNSIVSESIISDAAQLNSTQFQSDMNLYSQSDSTIIEEPFRGSSSLKYKDKCHLSKLELSSNKIYKCEQCSQEFFQKSKLQTHCLLHENHRPYKCFTCEKSYASKSKLSAHIRLHTKSNIYQCKFCSKMFTYPSYLEEHMNSHKSNNQIETQKIHGLECNICKKTFRFAKNLNAHFKLHSGKGLLECSICDKKFNKKYNLKIHLQSHDDKKLHKCKYCDKSFTQKSNLVEHTRIHTKVKPFECNLCNKRFSQSSHLKSHKATHESERQHHCQLCGKKFKLSSHLKRHLNSHTGSKTYRCDKCSQMFSQAFSLKRHLKRHVEASLQ